MSFETVWNGTIARTAERVTPPEPLRPMPLPPDRRRRVAVVAPTPPKPVRIVDRVRPRLLGSWQTLSEIAAGAACVESQVGTAIKAIGRTALVFRRQRRHAKHQPYEYRMFPQAFAVRLHE